MRLRKWFLWKRQKEWDDLPLETRQRIELEQQADLPGGWEAEAFSGEFT